MLLTLVIVYLLVTIGIGLYAAKRVKTTSDFAIAGRHLPFYMVTATVFATWFGSRLTARIDLQDRSSDALVRSEAAKHRCQDRGRY